MKGSNLTPDEDSELILLMARAAGCTCQPDIDKPVADAGGLLHIRIAHDDWCALLQRSTAEFN